MRKSIKATLATAAVVAAGLGSVVATTAPAAAANSHEFCLVQGSKKVVAVTNNRTDSATRHYLHGGQCSKGDFLYIYGGPKASAWVWSESSPRSIGWEIHGGWYYSGFPYATTGVKTY